MIRTSRLQPSSDARHAKGGDGLPETARDGQFRATLITQGHISEARYAGRIRKIETNRDSGANAPLFRPSLVVLGVMLLLVVAFLVSGMVALLQGGAFGDD